MAKWRGCRVSVSVSGTKRRLRFTHGELARRTLTHREVFEPEKADGLEDDRTSAWVHTGVVVVLAEVVTVKVDAIKRAEGS